MWSQQPTIIRACQHFPFITSKPNLEDHPLKRQKQFIFHIQCASLERKKLPVMPNCVE